MLNPDIVKELKQVNVGKDPEKTKERVKAIWKPLDKTKRASVFTMADITKFTVQRTYTNGTISAKLAVALAQVTDITPYYFTGETDDPQACTDELLVDFLIAKGYERLLTEPKKRRRKSNRKNEEQLILPFALFESNDTPSDTTPEISDDVPSDAAPEVSAEASSDAAPETSDDAPSVAPLQPTPTLLSKLLSVAQESIQALSEDEKAKLDNMPDDDVALLINGLARRGNYNNDAKCLSAFVKLLLTV